LPSPSKPVSTREAYADELLVSGALRIGIHLGVKEVEAFRLYREDLVRWSARMNLTALATPAQIVRQGFLDSLACASLLPINARRILDVGSGAGFPAIPLALANPDIEFTLVESSRKKTTFLRHIVRQLSLTRVHLRPVRIETLVDAPEMVARFDAALARAVAPLPDVIRLVLPFLRPGGVFLAQVGTGVKTGDAADGLSCAGFEIVGDRNVPLEFGKPGRRVIALRKSTAR